MHKQNETFNKEIETFQTKTKTKNQKEILELKNIRPDLKTSTNWGHLHWVHKNWWILYQVSSQGSSNTKVHKY